MSIGWKTGSTTAVDSVFGRVGIVSAQPGDYTVGQVVGAAPLASPTFSGVVDADAAAAVLVPTVAFPDSTTNAASTSFVTTAIAAGAPPIGAASGDLTGTYPSPVVAQLQGRAVDAAAPSSNYALRWDGASWVPTTPLPYNYEPEVRATPSASSAPGWIPYSTLAFTALEDGILDVRVTIILQGSLSTTQTASRPVVDGVPAGPGTLRETGIINGIDTASSTVPIFFTAGAHTISLEFQHAGGPGTTTALFSSIQVSRVG